MSKKTKKAEPDKVSAPTKPAKTTFNWWGLLPAALAFGLFATGFGNAMVAMDDHTATVDNEIVRDFSLSAFSRLNLGMYAPLTWMAYAGAYTLGKNAPFWYHFFGAAVHAINAFLVFRLFFRLTDNRIWALCIAVFFAIHPMQVEPVSWIAGFSTPLFSMFCLLAMVFYVAKTKDEISHHSQSASPLGGWQAGVKQVAALLFFLAACLSKSAAVVLPIVLLALDFWLKRPFSLKLITEKWAFFAISLVFGLMTFASRDKAGHELASFSGDFSIADRFLMICHTVLFYWTKLLAPLGLSVFNPFVKTASGAWSWDFYAAPFVLFGIIYGCWRGRARFPFLWFGLFFYLANVFLALPFYKIGTFELRSDRYNYLACLGLFFVLTALPWYFSKYKNVLFGLLAVLGAAWLFGVKTRIAVWKDTITLVSDAIEKGNHNEGKAYHWRAMELFKRNKEGDLPAAMEDFNKALSINPDISDAYKYRGALLGMGRKFEQSVADLEKYLAKNPKDADAWLNCGISLQKLNRHAEAIEKFDKALAVNPNFEAAQRAKGFSASQIN